MVSHGRTSLIAVGVLLMSLLPAGAVSAGHATPVTAQLAHLTAAPARPAYLDSAQPVALRVDDLLGRMTLEEKIGQMTQAERGAVAGDPSLIASWRLGSVLSGGGSTPTPEHAGRLGRDGQRVPEPGAEHPPAHPASSTASTPCTGTATSTARRSSRTTSASAPPATRRWSSRSGRPPRRRCGPPASRGTSRRASASPATSGGAARYESFGEDPALVIPDGVDHRRPAGSGGRRSTADRVLATAKHYAGDGDTEYDYAAAAPTWACRGISSGTRSTRASR